MCFIFVTSLDAQITERIAIDSKELTITHSNGFDMISLTGVDTYTEEVGCPKLPVIIKTYVIPWNKNVKGIDITVHDSTLFDKSVEPYPVQPSVEVNTFANNEIIIKDSSIYAEGVYPDKHVTIIGNYNEMGYRIVRIQINPIQYISELKKVVIKDISFTLNIEENPNPDSTPEKQSLRRTSIIKNMVKAIVDNPEDIDYCSNPNINIVSNSVPVTGRSIGYMKIDALAEQIPDYIIITSSILKDQFKRLSDWKTQKGLPSIMKMVEDIEDEYHGSDLSEKIQNYLIECKSKWGNGLFVLLGGDTNIVPTRFYMNNGESFPSDAYYMNLDNDWNGNKNNIFKEPDDGVIENQLCYLGRASVEDSLEAKIFVDKVLSYEMMNDSCLDKNYLKNHLAISAYISENSSGYLFNDGKNSINSYLSRYSVQNIIDKYYLFDHYNCSCEKHSDKTNFPKGSELNKENFIGALNNGYDFGSNKPHIVYHMDHSSPKLLGASSKDKLENLTISDIDRLSNGIYQQIFISGGCQPARFDKDCIAEHLINNPNGGAIAFVGNANNGWSSEYSQYNDFLAGLYSEKLSSLGVLVNKMNRETVFSPSSFVRLHLLGDPETPVWSGIPQSLDVSITPTQIIAGENQICIKINNLPIEETANVCIMKEGEAYLSTFISDTTTHIFTYTPKLSGEIKVTITARNFYPYIKAIPVIKNNSNLLSISHILDCNDALNIGQSSNINVFLKNTGTEDADSVVATLSTNSPYITFLDNVVEYGTITAGSTKDGYLDDKFAICVSSNAPEKASNEPDGVCMYVNISKKGTDIIDVDTFRLNITSPKLRIRNIKINSEVGPGKDCHLSFESAKTGKGEGGQIRWNVLPLSSNIENIVVVDSICSLNISQNCNLEELNLKIYLYSDNILQDSIVLDLTDALPVFDAGLVGFNSYSNSIYFNWPTIENASRYNVYRCSSINGEYIRMNKLPLDFRYFEDLDIIESTQYYYKFAALTESNVEGPKSNPITVTSSLPLLMQISPLNDFIYSHEANVADFDLDGEKEIIAQAYDRKTFDKSALIVVKADGTEPYDIDGNATNFGGYATFPWLSDAVPSVSDLRNNGEMSAIVFSRNFDSSYQNVAVNFSQSDMDGNNLPDTIWNSVIDSYVHRGAVVTDIDMADGKNEKEIVIALESSGILILNSDGTIRTRFGNDISGNYSGLAVSDLDNDGYKEIIYGQGSNLFVWKHDGSVYKRSPFFTRSGLNLKSSPIVCDFDNDGEKEIIIASRDSISYICVINQDGTCVQNFDGVSGNAVSIPYRVGTHEGLEHAVSVGDINNDGLLEIVALGNECVMAWKNSGEIIFRKDAPDVYKQDAWGSHFQLPILADVTGDGAADILYSAQNRIFAINNDGTDILGYPLLMNGEVLRSPCVADIDNDNRNEIIALDDWGYIYVWKSNGTAIEWGRSRFDNSFTGEYIKDYKDPMVITSNTVWGGGTLSNNLYLRSGIFTITENSELSLLNGNRIIVFNGATLTVDGGTINNANILIRDGGKLILDKCGNINISKYGSLEVENGAIVNVISGNLNN